MRKMLLSACLSAALALPGAALAAEPFSFGLWGDMPYAKNGDTPKMPALLASLNAAPIAFSLYDGDIKDGSSHCTDAVFTDALAMFNAMTKPVFYVPGDNEWTDCHRTNNGGYDPLERLSHLRKVMFANAGSLGKTRMAADHQAKPGEVFSENLRFSHHGIVFVTLNVPGSNNNKILNDKDCTDKSVRTPEACTALNAEYTARDAANIEWLRQSFAKAKADQAAGIVIVIQADPGFDLPETEDKDESKADRVSGYRNFMAAVEAETASFNGQVLFVHGDTHVFKHDKPLSRPSKLLANFTRLQTFGSPQLHWVRVDVDPTDPALFVVRPVIVPGN